MERRGSRPYAARTFSGDSSDRGGHSASASASASATATAVVATVAPPLGNPSSSSSSSSATAAVVGVGGGDPSSTVAQGIPACPDVATKRLRKEWDFIVEGGGYALIPHCVCITQKAAADLFEWLVYVAPEAFSADSTPTEGGACGCPHDDSLSFAAANSPQSTQECQEKPSLASEEELQKCVVLEVTFPRNYPFSPPYISCQDFALFVPKFIPEWSPRMKIQALLSAVIQKLPSVWVPVNHLRCASATSALSTTPTASSTTTDDVTLDSAGLRVTNESSLSRTVLLCVNPMDVHDRYYWSVHMNSCSPSFSATPTMSSNLSNLSGSGGGSPHTGFRTHSTSSSSSCVSEGSADSSVVVGVTTLWPGRNLIQYIWGYLDDGVVQLILLPKGSDESSGDSPVFKVEKLNRYEYAAEELHTFPVESFTTGDTISVFYDGGSDPSHTLSRREQQAGKARAPPPPSSKRKPSLSFYKNGNLQCVVQDCLSFHGATIVSPWTQSAPEPTSGSSTSVLSPVWSSESPLTATAPPLASTTAVDTTKPSARGRPRHSVTDSAGGTSTTMARLNSGPLAAGGVSPIMIGGVSSKASFDTRSRSSETSSNSPTSSHSPSALSPLDRLSALGIGSILGAGDPRHSVELLPCGGRSSVSSLASVHSTGVNGVGSSTDNVAKGSRRHNSKYSEIAQQKESIPSVPVVDGLNLLFYPAISLGRKGDTVTFEFEPPLWDSSTHCFYPINFTRIVTAVLFALEKRYRLSRAASVAIISWIGVGYSRIGMK